MLIIGLQLATSSQYMRAQTNLNPPNDSSLMVEPIDEVLLPEFESGPTELLKVSKTSSAIESNLTGEPISIGEPKIVGHNKQGVPEYSVLENTPGELVVEHGLPAQSTIEQPTEEPQLDQVNQPPQETVAVSDELNQWLTALVLKHMPHEYVQDKKWGKQAKRWAGVNLRRDKQESKSRYKMVNHGTWQKYAAELIDPENKFAVRMSDVSKTQGGKTAFDVGFVANLKIDARQSKWVKGVQLYSISAKGRARIALAVSCELGVGMDLSNFPPDLVFSPEITDAKISIVDFKLDRVSKVGGEVAQQMARHARRELEGRIHEKEEKLVQKLNQEIDENREKLRLSISEAVRLKWYKQTREFLPDDVKKTLAANQPVELPNSQLAAGQARSRKAQSRHNNRNRRSAYRPTYTNNNQKNVRRPTSHARTNIKRPTHYTNSNNTRVRQQTNQLPKPNFPNQSGKTPYRR